MNNFKQPGDSVTRVAPSGGVTSGLFYKIGQLLMCAAFDAAVGLSFVGKTTGVFSAVPKTTSEAWTVGAVLYWNNSTAKFTTTSSGNLLVGSADAAAGASDTTGDARLDGIARVDS